MKVCAIIAEYNPFHNGHLYQIKQIKSQGYKIVVILSSSFTQRGIPSIYNKFIKTDCALKAGVDLVLELPVIFSTANAEIFAKGAIGILNSLATIDALFFGTENSLEDIIEIENKIRDNKSIIDENIKMHLKTGVSHLKAKELSLNFLDNKSLDILKKPNNILAFEYIRALNFFNSNIKAKSILRKNVYHNSKNIIHGISSASNIRNILYENNNNIQKIKKLVPNYTIDGLLNSKLNNYNNYFEIIKYKLLDENINFNNFMDYENGLENRLLKYIGSEDIFQLILNTSSKRYTKSRISRLIIQIILGIEKDLIFNSLGKNYIRVLGSNRCGFEILKEIQRNNDFVIDKFAKINLLKDDNIIKKIAKKEILATNIYNLYTSSILNEDFIHPLNIIK